MAPLLGSVAVVVGVFGVFGVVYALVAVAEVGEPVVAVVVFVWMGCFGVAAVGASTGCVPVPRVALSWVLESGGPRSVVAAAAEWRVMTGQTCRTWDCL